MSPLTLSSHRHWMLIRDLQANAVAPLGRSEHFAVYGLPRARDDDSDDIIVVHHLLPAQIDNNIGSYVAEELLPMLSRARSTTSSSPDDYAYSEQETFERYVGAIVRSIDGNERRAWHRFYDNTLKALRAEPTLNGGRGNDFIRSFRAIYGCVARLAAEVKSASILDAATCFGFLPLFLAGAHHAEPMKSCRITGCDLNPALVALAEDYRRQRGIAGVNFVRADVLAGGVIGDLASAGPFDLVTAIHFLEHLAAADTEAAIKHLWALTGRRLIVAVPLETEPDPRFGHLQVFDCARLDALGRCLSGDYRTFEYHGGWLVADRS